MNARENDPTEFEQRLAAWLPTAPALDRDRVLFEAGRASARAEGRSKILPCTTVVLAIAFAGLGGLFVREHSQRLALESSLAARPPMLAEMPQPVAPPPKVESPGPSSYFVMTARLASGELDLPPIPSKPHGGSPSSAPRPPTLRTRGFERALDL